MKKNGLLHAALSQLKEKQERAPRSPLHARSQVEDLLASNNNSNKSMAEPPAKTGDLDWESDGNGDGESDSASLRTHHKGPKTSSTHDNKASRDTGKSSSAQGFVGEDLRLFEVRQELAAAKRKIESLLKEREMILERLER